MSAHPTIGYAGMTLSSASARRLQLPPRVSATIGFDGDAALIGRLDAGQLPVVERGSR